MKSTVLHRRELREIKEVTYHLRSLISNALYSTEEHRGYKFVEITFKRICDPITKKRRLILIVKDNLNYKMTVSRPIGGLSFIKAETDMLFTYVSKLASKGFEEIEKFILSPLT